MKKIVLALTVLSVLALPVAALALDPSSPPTNAIPNLPTAISAIETLIWVVFGAIAVITFVIAGILFLTAAGNPEKVQQARNAFLWGVAGIVVGIIAYSILIIIGSALNV